MLSIVVVFAILCRRRQFVLSSSSFRGVVVVCPVVSIRSQQPSSLVRWTKPSVVVRVLSRRKSQRVGYRRIVRRQRRK